MANEEDPREGLARERTDLAEDRTVLAHERSFAGWVRTGMAAVGIGLGFNALFQALEPTWVPKAIATAFLAMLAAMIPVGRSFQDSGAADLVAQWLGGTLAGVPLFGVLAALCGATLLLSIFLNNVATAIIMGPIAIDAAGLLHVPPDAALLAVLIGASADFLTPIGHQNNLLVMGPGGYRFGDYARMGAPLVAIVVVVSAAVLSFSFD